MDYFVPIHQFIIRYSQLLNFPQVAQKAVAPFIPLCKQFQVENEFNRNAKYTLSYGNYVIILQREQMFFQYEGEPQVLSETSSIVQDPFFAIFTRLSESEMFGVVKEVLILSIFVKPDTELAKRQEVEKNEKQRLAQDIADKYLKVESLSPIMEEIDDIGIVLDRFEGQKQVVLSFGPYFGFADINKRGLVLTTNEMLERCKTFGQMCEIRIVDKDAKGANFGRYKVLSNMTQSYIKKLWT